jgi:hypothetical protein
MEAFRMRKIMIFLAVFGLAASLWAADPWTGTYKMNLAKSKLAPSTEAAPKEETLVIREVGMDNEGSIKGTRTDGSPILEKWVVPLQGGIVKYQQGGPGKESYYVGTRVGMNEVYWTLLQNGKQMALYHFTLSQDGKIIRGVGKFPDEKGNPFESLEIWERQ